MHFQCLLSSMDHWANQGTVPLHHTFMSLYLLRLSKSIPDTSFISDSDNASIHLKLPMYLVGQNILTGISGNFTAKVNLRDFLYGPSSTNITMVYMPSVHPVSHHILTCWTGEFWLVWSLGLTNNKFAQESSTEMMTSIHYLKLLKTTLGPAVILYHFIHIITALKGYRRNQYYIVEQRQQAK